jgi:hypothetical protein
MATATSELSNYFEGFDRLPSEQQEYIADSLGLWVTAGYVDVLINHKMTAKIGQSFDRTRRRVILDQDEFAVEFSLFRKLGPLARVNARTPGFFEARLNLAVAHEMGHQIYLMLSPDAKTRIETLHKNRVEQCDRMHPFPDGYEGNSELVTADQVNERVFLTGYSRSSPEEYFAESFAAFSMKSSREKLKAIDAEIFDMVRGLVYSPNELLHSDWTEEVARSQAERKQRQELTDTLVD